MLIVSYFLKLQRQPFLSRFLNFSKKKRLQKITKTTRFLGGLYFAKFLTLKNRNKEINRTFVSSEKHWKVKKWKIHIEKGKSTRFL